MKQGLGTQLRHLIELLDGAVEQSYADAGLDYRPRYTPVMKALLAREPLTVGDIAAQAGITQPAATQTVALMIKQGLLTATTGQHDGRQKMIKLSKSGRALLAQIQQCWQATTAAANSLDAQLPYPLSTALADAIAALEHQPFGERIRAARTAADGVPPG